MPISFDEKNMLFHLATPNSSYVMACMYGKVLTNLHYGGRITCTEHLKQLVPYRDRAFSAMNVCFADRAFSTDTLQMEYPTYGNTDLRTPAFHAVHADGSTITKLEYAGHKSFSGKPKLAGLPATYTERDDEAQTLEIELRDAFAGLSVFLSYTVFEQLDVIAKSVRVVNNGEKTVQLHSVLSSSTDLPNNCYDMLTLDGCWARERQISRGAVRPGMQAVDSKRGSSSHHHNPFMALVGAHTTEFEGEAYGFSLVYSGNFVAGAELDAYDTVRCQIGINPFNFCWNLKPGETFQSPEAVLVYSAAGLHGLSDTYHKLYRTRLCRGKYRDAMRPVLANNWEGTYFNFTEEKILSIAEKAKDIGLDLMVLDDGWFGRRDDATSSLGDWYPHVKKLPDGIAGLADKVEALGLRFGLWFEPEMVSPGSELYRAHPDWCLHVPGRDRNLGRNQLILDYSRDDVCDYIIQTVGGILSSAKISYVKWDMNRNMSDVGSALLPPEQQREVMHRYILGLYRVMETLTAAHPDVLFEGCSGGGGRFDPGMLYYMPQIWTSDNSDAISRLYIQHGTSMVYPASAMCCHVCAVPNHQTGRVTPFNTRANVALMGQFGYELDLTNMSDEELAAAKEQVALYKRLRPIIQHGTMYRLKSPFEDGMAVWQFVSEDGKEVVVFIHGISVVPHGPYINIRLRGLDGQTRYACEDGSVLSGDVLMHMGFCLEIKEDFASEVRLFIRK